jgi:hypothetical protein
MLDKLGGALLGAATDAVFGEKKDGGTADFGAALDGVRPPPFEVAVDRQQEGLFHNRSATYDQPGQAVVFRDRYKGGGADGQSLGVEGTVIEHGQSARGDAILYDSNNNGRLDPGDTVFKVPNQKWDESWNLLGTFNIRNRDDRFGFKVEGSDPRADGILNAAELKSPLTNDYGEMTVPEFARLMGDKPLYVNGELFYEP